MKLPPLELIVEFASLLNMQYLILETNFQNDEDMETLKSYLDRSRMEMGIPYSFLTCSDMESMSALIVTDSLGGRPGNSKDFLTKYTPWLVPEGHLNLEELELTLSSLVFTYSDTPGGIVMKEWYKVKGKTFTKIMGSWTQAQGLDIPITNPMERRSNLGGSHGPQQQCQLLSPERALGPGQVTELQGQVQLQAVWGLWKSDQQQWHPPVV